jgi:hypothetical protein
MPALSPSGSGAMCATVNLHALRKRKGWKTGRTAASKGQEPFNKGKPHPTRGRAAETQFKKGRRAAQHEVARARARSKDGYVEISIAETNPHTGYGAATS